MVGTFALRCPNLVSNIVTGVDHKAFTEKLIPMLPIAGFWMKVLLVFSK